MNRRAFCGAFAAILTLPVVALANRSVPRFVANGRRLAFAPHSEYDWIDLPSRIIGLDPRGDELIITCSGGVYVLSCSGTPEHDWFITERGR